MAVSQQPVDGRVGRGIERDEGVSARIPRVTGYSRSGLAVYTGCRTRAVLPRTD